MSLLTLISLSLSKNVLPSLRTCTTIFCTQECTIGMYLISTYCVTNYTTSDYLMNDTNKPSFLGQFFSSFFSSKDEPQRLPRASSDCIFSSFVNSNSVHSLKLFLSSSTRVGRSFPDIAFAMISIVPAMLLRTFISSSTLLLRFCILCGGCTVATAGTVLTEGVSETLRASLLYTLLLVDGTGSSGGMYVSSSESFGSSPYG